MSITMIIYFEPAPKSEASWAVRVDVGWFAAVGIISSFASALGGVCVLP